MYHLSHLRVRHTDTFRAACTKASLNETFDTDLYEHTGVDEYAGPELEDIIYASPGGFARWTHPEGTEEGTPNYKLPVHVQNIENLKALCRQISETAMAGCTPMSYRQSPADSRQGGEEEYILMSCEKQDRLTRDRLPGTTPRPRSAYSHTRCALRGESTRRRQLSKKASRAPSSTGVLQSKIFGHARALELFRDDNVESIEHGKIACFSSSKTARCPRNLRPRCPGGESPPRPSF